MPAIRFVTTTKTINSTRFRMRIMLIAGVAVVLGACAGGTRVTRIKELSESADSPYENILVVTLLSSFDSRRYLEEEIVAQLAALGTAAVPSTSLMNTRTPVIRETFVKMVKDVDADALLLTQLTGLRSEGTFVDMNPESTVNLRPTGYWNVFSVDTTEYVEPRAVDFEHSLVLMTQLYSVKNREAVWGIESRSQYSLGFDQAKDYSIIVNEAKAIVRSLSRDGMISR